MISANRAQSPHISIKHTSHVAKHIGISARSLSAAFHDKRKPFLLAAACPARSRLVLSRCEEVTEVGGRVGDCQEGSELYLSSVHARVMRCARLPASACVCVLPSQAVESVNRSVESV